MHIFIFSIHNIFFINQSGSYQRYPIQVKNYLTFQLFKQMKMEPELKIEHSFNLPQRAKNNRQIQGKNLNIISNYFPIRLIPFRSIYIFKVTFEPMIAYDNRKQRNKILEKALPSIKQQIHNPVIGGMNIYSVSEPTSTVKQYCVQQYKILIKQVKQINIKANPKLFTLFLNNGIRNIMSCLGYMEIGKTGKYFQTDTKVKINSMFVYKGFKVNFLLAEAGLFLRVDPSFKVVQSNNVLERIDEIYKANSHKSREQKRMLIKQALIGKIIMTNYGKARYVKVEDIQFFQQFKSVLIPGSKNMNILDYYKEKYQMQIKCQKGPLLKIENRNKKDLNAKIYMPPQLCLMTGYPQQNFDQRIRKKIQEQTIVSPNTKFQTINNFVKQILSHSQTVTLNELGIQISQKPLQISAKRLQAPKLKIGENKTIERGKQEFFNLFSNPIYDHQRQFSVKVAVICYDKKGLNQMFTTIQNTCPNLRVKLSLQIYQINKKGSRFQKQQFKNIVNLSREKKCNFCLIVLQNNMASYYPQIKEICLKDFNMMSQVVLRKTLNKGNESVYTKILLQILVKSGFTLWCPSISKQLNPVMLVSFDMKKYMTEKGKRLKIIGIGSMNQEKTQFSSDMEDIENSCDKFVKMVKILFNLLVKYQSKNKKLPSEIIVLTDTSPYAQIKMYNTNFVPLFYDYIKQIGDKASLLKLTIIQVRDISSERFFQTSYGQKGACMNNPPGGLLISNSIVSQNYDFFLVSQKPRNGCTVPIHFNIINTNSQLKEEFIHQLLYNSCFNYANFTGVIKLPSIIQYAKKLSRFSASVLNENNITESYISDRLYFI